MLISAKRGGREFWTFFRLMLNLARYEKVNQKYRPILLKNTYFKIKLCIKVLYFFKNTKFINLTLKHSILSFCSSILNF